MTAEKKPLISIAVATYNGGKYLRTQIDSLLAQTYPNLEIIVSDDGSKDGTFETLKEYESAHSHFHVFENGAPHGVKRNFENALKHCKGEFIAFADQDDYWLPQKIGRLADHIGSNALIYHDSLFVNYEGESLNKTIQTKLRCYEGKDPRAFLFCNTVSGHALLFHRRMLDIALPFPDARHHDWWLAFRATENGGVKFLDEVLVHYRQHPKSQTDFFNLKTKKIDKEKIDREDREWYAAVAEAPGKHQKFFKDWLKAYDNKEVTIFSREKFAICLSALDKVFYMRKRSKVSTFLHMLRLSWTDNTRSKFRRFKNKALGRPDKPNDDDNA